MGRVAAAECAGRSSLSQPLLAEEGAAETATSECWNRTLGPLVAIALATAAAFAAYWRTVTPTEQPLSEEQSAALQGLRDRALRVFDERDAGQARLLEQLWASAMDRPLPGARGAWWSDELGFQGVSPSSDLRAAGLLGLQCLAWFACTLPAPFRAMRERVCGCAPLSPGWYPFCTAGVGLAARLVDELGVVRLLPGSKPAPPPSRPLAALLAADPLAFERLFAAAFALLDRLFVARRASYIDFNTVMEATLARVKEALSESQLSPTVESVLSALEREA